jgi:hypothetical protein
LTQELVRLHGGKMEVESTYGQGTTFTVYIPVGNDHLPQNQLSNGQVDHGAGFFGQSMVEEAGKWTLDTDSSESSREIAPLQRSVWIPPSTVGSKVLIVDDNDDLRRFVKGVLIQCYQVAEATILVAALALTSKPS